MLLQDFISPYPSLIMIINEIIVYLAFIFSRYTDGYSFAYKIKYIP